jgi:hypothetical protein
MEYHVTWGASSKSIVEARSRLQTDEHRTSRLHRTEVSASQTQLLGDSLSPAQDSSDLTEKAFGKPRGIYVRTEVLTAVKMSMSVFWSSALKMEAICSSETLVYTCKSAFVLRRHKLTIWPTCSLSMTDQESYRIIYKYHLHEQKLFDKISGSHGDEYKDDCLLGCCAVLSGRYLPTFRRCLLPPSSGRSPRRQSSSVTFGTPCANDHYLSTRFRSCGLPRIEINSEIMNLLDRLLTVPTSLGFQRVRVISTFLPRNRRPVWRQTMKSSLSGMIHFCWTA